MGFGTLFIGYFFLLNISYFTYTDIIAGMVILLGLYKLSSVNKPFLYGMIGAMCFAVFSLIEFVITVLGIFEISFSGIMLNYIAIPRYILLFALTVFIFRGISEVAKEVGADALSKRSGLCIPLSLIYLFFAFLDIPEIAAALSGFSAYAYIYFALIILYILAVAYNLITIYRAYMQICMPNEKEKEIKESKFAFVNKFRAYEERKSREYAEYKLDKMKKNNEKKKNKRKK